MSGFISALMKQRKDAKQDDGSSGRLKEILAILKKYDYEDGITPEIIVNILQDLGPTFVKIGQIASQQSDSIPKEYCDELAKLRSKVAPMELDAVYAQIEKHLGKPVDELFASFDDKPLGSASIGQVHKAELPDGTVVAVKVRRPGVVDTVARDFALIEKILDLNTKLMPEDVAGFGIQTMIEELEHTSKLELDFTNEARNLERFYENNAGREGVTSPKCYRDYTDDGILTEDFVSGPEAGDIAYVESLDTQERDRLATLVADNFATQILTDGFYHADPHSGNVLLVDDGIEWIDFGMMGSLTSSERQTLIDLVTAVVKHDAYGLKRCVLKVATPQGPVDHGTLLELSENMTDQVSGTDFGDFNLGDLLDTILDALQQESYKIDPFLTNLARGIVAAEGTVKALSPNVNILNCFIDKVNLGFDPEKLESDVTALVMKALQGVDDLAGLPTKAVETLDMLEKGQIRVTADMGFDGKGLRNVDRLAKNALLAFMSIALFLGSCILCLMPDPSVSRAWGIPIVGLVGFLIGVCFMCYVVHNIKKGK